VALPRPIGSVNDEFNLGAIEGSYKLVIKDRGGVVESGSWEARKQLSVKTYGIVEAPVKDVPARGRVRTLNTVPTPDPERMGY
jgi:hypothetical protein